MERLEYQKPHMTCKVSWRTTKITLHRHYTQRHNQIWTRCGNRAIPHRYSHELIPFKIHFLLSNTKVCRYLNEQQCRCTKLL